MNRNVGLKESILPDIKFNTKPNLQTHKLIKNIMNFCLSYSGIIVVYTNTPLLSHTSSKERREKKQSH